MEEKVRQKMIVQKEQMEEMEVGIAELCIPPLQSFESIGVIPIELYEGWSLMERNSSNSEPLFNRLMLYKFKVTLIQAGLFSASQFESHAGYGSCRKPYLNIYTSNGVSLHDLSVSMSKSRKLSGNDNDLCNYCQEFGDILCCDMCPRAFHQGERLEVLMVY